MTVDDMHVLGVLAADLENGVDARIGAHRSSDVGRDLVDYGIRADDLADHLATAAGRSDRLYFERGPALHGQVL